MTRKPLQSLMLAMLTSLTVIAADPDSSSKGSPNAKAFSLQPVPLALLKSERPYLSLMGFIPEVAIGKESDFFTEAGPGIPFKVIEHPGKKGRKAIAPDWDRDGKFDEKSFLELPVAGGMAVSTLTIDGNEYRAVLVRPNDSLLLLRNANWYRGQVRVGQKVHETAMVDTDFNGIKTDGTDVLVLDLDGDEPFDLNATAQIPAMQLSRMIMLDKRFHAVEYDSKKMSLTIEEITDFGTVAITHPYAETVSLSGRTLMGNTHHQLTVNDNAFKLPVGTIDKITLNVTIGDFGTSRSRLQYQLTDMELKVNQTVKVSLAKPTGIEPKLRISGGVLNVSEKLIFAKEYKHLHMSSRFTDVGKRSGRPIITVYKGKTRIAQASMQYG